MLKTLISSEDCHKCKKCCVFEEKDLWEIPIFSNELKERIKEKWPNVKFKKYGNQWKIELCKDGHIYLCPFLDFFSGCTLYDNKPLECKLWPFYIMDSGGLPVLAISPECDVMNSKSLVDILGVAKTLKMSLHEIAQENPEIIKKNISGFLIF